MTHPLPPSPFRPDPIPRRDLLRTVTGGAALMALGPMLASCATTTRTAASARPAALIEQIGAPRAKILQYASLAPSGHNTQPWRVAIEERDRWTLALDEDRLLPDVDPERREALLSLGHFIENLVIAAGSIGFTAEVEVLAEERQEREVARIHLSSRSPVDYPLRKLSLRRTLRSGFLPETLSRSDLDALLAPLDGMGTYFPRGSREANWLQEAEVEAMRKQTWRDSAQQELSNWVHLDRSRAESRQDGLTPETMEVSWFGRQFMYLFMDEDSVMTERFREKGIETATQQAGEGAGWLVVTSPDQRPSSILKTGRRVQRMWLQCRERRIAIHPMSQVLEEEPWRQQIANAVGLDQKPQYLLRVGYVSDYPEPVSMRRPVEDFTTLA
jgi:Nitroreductase family.